jgi:hypothetical protein
VEAECQEAEAELKALWSSAARVRDIVLKRSGGTSFLVASLSSVAELLEGRIDATTANGVC